MATESNTRPIPPTTNGTELVIQIARRFIDISTEFKQPLTFKEALELAVALRTHNAT